MWGMEEARELLGTDPVATCSGCSNVGDFLEASFYYGRDLERAGQDYGHVIPPNPVEICASAYLAYFRTREDVFGYARFVRSGTPDENGVLNSLCSGIYAGGPNKFRALLHKGKGAQGLCSEPCGLSRGLRLKDKLEHAAFNKGGVQVLRLAPYAFLAALLLAVTAQYLYSLLKRLLSWWRTEPQRQKKKKKKDA